MGRCYYMWNRVCLKVGAGLYSKERILKIRNKVKEEEAKANLENKKA